MKASVDVSIMTGLRAFLDFGRVQLKPKRHKFLSVGQRLNFKQKHLEIKNQPQVSST